jgi:hypothetical protein
VAETDRLESKYLLSSTPASNGAGLPSGAGGGLAWVGSQGSANRGNDALGSGLRVQYGATDGGQAQVAGAGEAHAAPSGPAAVSGSPGGPVRPAATTRVQGTSNGQYDLVLSQGHRSHHPGAATAPGPSEPGPAKDASPLIAASYGGGGSYYGGYSYGGGGSYYTGYSYYNNGSSYYNYGGSSYFGHGTTFYGGGGNYTTFFGGGGYGTTFYGGNGGLGTTFYGGAGGNGTTFYGGGGGYGTTFYGGGGYGTTFYGGGGWGTTFYGGGAGTYGGSYGGGTYGGGSYGGSGYAIVAPTGSAAARTVGPAASPPASPGPNQAPTPISPATSITAPTTLSPAPAPAAALISPAPAPSAGSSAIDPASAGAGAIGMGILPALGSTDGTTAANPTATVASGAGAANSGSVTAFADPTTRDEPTPAGAVGLAREADPPAQSETQDATHADPPSSVGRMDLAPGHDLARAEPDVVDASRPDPSRLL